MASQLKVDLSGPTFCVVTGASQGIGRAIAVEVSKHMGPNSVLLLLARKKDDLAKSASLCESANVKVVYTSIDLAVAPEKEMYDVLVQALGGRKVTDFSTGVIFHNVGSIGNLTVPSWRMEDVQELRDNFTLNVFKVISLNTQFLKVFEEIEDRLVIVNITSLCAVQPMAGLACYCSGKAARGMYFKVLAEEKKNLVVLNYSPGPVETAMTDHIIDTSVDSNLRQSFVDIKAQGVILKPEMTAKKCLKFLLEAKFKSGDHIDYFDDEQPTPRA